MEELNLQALEEEYKSLKGTLTSLNGRMTEAETAHEAAKEAAVEAGNAFQTAKTAYETMKNLYENNIKANTREDGSFIVPVETYDSIKEQMETLKLEMEAAEEEKKAKDAAVKSAEESFNGIQADAQKADERMNLILTSFGANEKINQALVNEFQNTYYDKIEGVQSKKAELDSLRTKINEDEDLRKLLFGDKEAGIEGLEEILAQYKEAADKGPSKEVGEINKKAVKLYSTINARLKKLGLKGVSLSNEEINMMLTEKDDQGRMVVPEIDRRIAAEDTKIATLEAERDSIIEVMGITLEMSKDPVNGTPELQALLEETVKLQSEVDAAQTIFDESGKKLTELGQEKTDLTAKIEKLRAENPNYDEIIALEAELATAGATGSLPNPEYTDLKAEIEKTKQELADDTEIDNPDYIAQKAKVDAAEKALKDEEGNMNPEKEEPDDVIEGNGMHLMMESGLQDAIDQYEAAKNANPEVAKLYDDIKIAMENVEDSEASVKECTTKEDEAFKKLTSKYVSNTVYPDLKKPESEASKALDGYKAAELAVREAMLAYQNDPSKENKQKLEAAMAEYNRLAEAFKAALKASVGDKGELPSTEAIHDYLLHVLNKERPTDKAYNIKGAQNRIALLERAYKTTDKAGLVTDLAKTSKNLDKMLPMLLSGEIGMSGDLFQLAMQDHEGAIAKFGDAKADIVSRLTGTGPVVDPKTLKWWQRLFNRMPKEKVEYDFKKIVKPAEYGEWDAAKGDLADAKASLKADKDDLKALTEGLDEDQKAYLEKLDVLDNRVKNAEEELAKTPEKVNKSKLARLKAALDKEKDILGRTPAKKSSKDKEALRARLAELEEKIKTVPEFTGDSKEVEAKKEKLAELKGKNPGVAEISESESRLEEIAEEELAEQQKNADAEKTLKDKKPTLAKKLSRISLLQKIKDRFRGVTEFIKIKDAGKMSDNRKPIARTLANDVKSKAEEDAER